MIVLRTLCRSLDLTVDLSLFVVVGVVALPVWRRGAGRVVRVFCSIARTAFFEMAIAVTIVINRGRVEVATCVWLKLIFFSNRLDSISELTRLDFQSAICCRDDCFFVTTLFCFAI